MKTTEPGNAWVPPSCTLPTAERPLRVAAFDAVFADSIHEVVRPEPDRLRLTLEPTAEVAARVADLAVRETSCCAFFAFSQTAAAGSLQLEISASPGHRDVLDALADRAAAGAAGHP